MALFNIWSRRKRTANKTQSDPLQYESLPNNLKVQIVHILNEIEIEADKSQPGLCYEVVKILRKDIGVFKLTERFCNEDIEELSDFIINASSPDRVLDAIELTIVLAHNWRSEWTRYNSDLLKSQIEELNGRFLEAGVGYQIEGTQFIEMSDEFNHSENIVPTISLIYEHGYDSARSEFLEAHSAFRAKDYQKTLTECAKALESTLKVIAEKQGWEVSSTSNLSHYIKAAFSEGFLPKYLEDGFSGLRSMLTTVGTVRNKDSAHGAGVTARTVSKHLARFQLNQTAAVIRFLIDECEK